MNNRTEEIDLEIARLSMDVEKIQKSISETLIAVITDKSLPVSGRWGLYCRYSNFLDTGIDVQFSVLNGKEWSTPLFFDDYNFISGKGVYDICSKICLDDDQIDNRYVGLSPESLVILQEEIMASKFGWFVWTQRY